jgi:hypothetical protein
MNEVAAESLTFSAVDGLAYAAKRNRLEGIGSWKRYLAGELGPAMELRQLAADGSFPQVDQLPYLSMGSIRDLCAALGRRWSRPWLSADRNRGFFRTDAELPEDDLHWTTFRYNAQQAAVKAGFPKETAHEFAGALGEMHSNIYEHSEAANTGMVAFSASPGLFEFVVADRGIGVLRSLKTCPEYASLKDHGDALERALTDGSSRYGLGTNHGKGFRPLFIGLSNLNGSLRFRSGDHALTIEGRDPKHLPWRKARKTPISGFLASVACSLSCAAEPTRVDRTGELTHEGSRQAGPK